MTPRVPRLTIQPVGWLEVRLWVALTACLRGKFVT